MKATNPREIVKAEGAVVLRAEGLGVGLEGGGGRVVVVGGVDLALVAGRTTALVGESGCGKSVTAAALGGLLPPGMRMDEGRLVWGGRAAAGGRGLGYVFQDPGVCLNPVWTIGNQIRETLPRGERGRWRERVEELLARVGLAESGRVLASYPHQLSGGMQQRAMLAMALAGRPRVLVADEPTTALDVTVQAKILELLADIQRREHLAVLLITHNLGVVAEVADEVHVMYAGRMVESGGVGLLRAPRHPYVRGLLRALPQLEEGGARLEGIEGTVPTPGRYPPGCRFHPRCGLARAVCAERAPPWTDCGGGHRVACWAVGPEGWS